MLSLTCAGFSFFRFTSSAWSTYLLSTAYIAIRAGRWNSYAHVIAYCGMVTFQTVVYMSSLCWLAYSLYALEYQMHVYIMQRREFELLTRTSPNIVLVLMVVEVVAMIGTVFTGVFGMIACCRGLGKLLHQQEQMIMVC
uniref:Membrane-associated protein n=1 Tax=Heterorhabditis bacteriophora TaxID=37862 RepID=A0A1I7X458_HETBA